MSLEKRPILLDFAAKMGYSRDEMEEFMNELFEPLSSHERERKENPIPLSKELKINEYLVKLGFKSNLRGTHYIRTVLEQFDNIVELSMTKQVYPEVARIHNTKPTRVERAIRHSIEEAYANSSEIVKMFGETVSLNKGKPTNSEFLAFLCDVLNGRIPYSFD